MIKGRKSEVETLENLNISHVWLFPPFFCFFFFFQEPECELGADCVRLFWMGEHAGAEPSLLLRVLGNHPLERRQLPQIPSHQQHPAARSAEGDAQEPRRQEVRRTSPVRGLINSTTSPSPPRPLPLHQARLALSDFKAGCEYSVWSVHRQR